MSQLEEAHEQHACDLRRSRLLPGPKGAPADWERSFFLKRPWRQVVTTPVGSFPEGASPHGALDMAGNVYEWTADG